MTVGWITSGVPANRMVRIALYHLNNDVTTLLDTANTGQATVRLPNPEYLQYFTSASQTGTSDMFSLRLDVQHSDDEISRATPWSTRLVNVSGTFEISGLQ